MNDVATLITAIAGLVGALGGPIVAIFLALQTSKKERKSAVPTVAHEIIEASKDGDLTVEEVLEILDKRGEDAKSERDSDQS